ncbi:hypothetical protein DWX13_00960 [Eubacterium sp. AF18-3]|nr:hypothetical protein DWX13_00960 [Eubacterium sp. AF18-3]
MKTVLSQPLVEKFFQCENYIFWNFICAFFCKNWYKKTRASFVLVMCYIQSTKGIEVKSFGQFGLL